MNVLVLEDEDKKFDLVALEIKESFSDRSVNIARAKNFALATKNIYETSYDLIVIDLMMPMRDGDDATDISEDVISTLELSNLNQTANVVALSGYSELVESQRKTFTDAGIILVQYDEKGELWKKLISSALLRLRDQVIFDFAIICALEKERAAYRNTKAKVGELKNIRGIDCMILEIGPLRGVCVKLPRMGLVEAAITTTKVIDFFQPDIIAMSGICAGVEGNSKLGALVVADICWEYQAGKWADTGFKIEHYDVPLAPVVKTTLSQIIAKDEKGESIKQGLMDDVVKFEPIVIAPMSTGSAVIASGERIEQIGAQHRKMAALDMEMYGVYKSAEQSARPIYYFGVKTVVDLANSAKGDTYHEYGSILSARFAVEGIESIRASLIADRMGPSRS